MKKLVNTLLMLAVLVGMGFVAPSAEAGCARHMIANVDTCPNAPCPPVICTLIGEGGGYCIYTC